MLDMKFLRNNPEIVKENIRKKFQDQKLPLVDEVIEFDRKFRAAKTRCDELRNQRNVISKQIGGLMAQGKKEEAEAAKEQVKAMAEEMAKLEEDEKVYAEEVKARMMVIPNIIDPSVPIGKDGLASRWFRTSRCPTTWTSWKAWTASTWIPPGGPPGTGFTTSRVM